MKVDQNSCKHRYVEHERDEEGYWFRCIYCGKDIFGRLAK